MCVVDVDRPAFCVPFFPFTCRNLLACVDRIVTHLFLLIPPMCWLSIYGHITHMKSSGIIVTATYYNEWNLGKVQKGLLMCILNTVVAFALTRYAVLWLLDWPAANADSSLYTECALVAYYKCGIIPPPSPFAQNWRNSILFPLFSSTNWMLLLLIQVCNSTTYTHSSWIHCYKDPSCHLTYSFYSHYARI